MCPLTNATVRACQFGLCHALAQTQSAGDLFSGMLMHRCFSSFLLRFPRKWVMDKGPLHEYCSLPLTEFYWPLDRLYSMHANTCWASTPRKTQVPHLQPLTMRLSGSQCHSVQHSMFLYASAVSGLKQTTPLFLEMPSVVFLVSACFSVRQQHHNGAHS